MPRNHVKATKNLTCNKSGYVILEWPLSKVVIPLNSNTRFISRKRNPTSFILFSSTNKFKNIIPQCNIDSSWGCLSHYGRARSSIFYKNSLNKYFVLVQSSLCIHIEQIVRRRCNGFTFSQPAHISRRWKSRDAPAWRHYSGHRRHNTTRWAGDIVYSKRILKKFNIYAEFQSKMA